MKKTGREFRIVVEKEAHQEGYYAAIFLMHGLSYQRLYVTGTVETADEAQRQAAEVVGDPAVMQQLIENKKRKRRR